MTTTFEKYRTACFRETCEQCIDGREVLLSEEEAVG